MILLTLSRGKGEETVRLQLPASPAEIGETFAFLDRISLDISDLEAYRRAASFYFDGAVVQSVVTICLTPAELDPDRDGILLDLSDFF